VEFTRALLDMHWYGLAISLAYPCGEEGGILLVQMISTCLLAAHCRKGGGSATCVLDENGFIENGNLFACCIRNPDPYV
jgi:hypothetical protein